MLTVGLGFLFMGAAFAQNCPASACKPTNGSFSADMTGLGASDFHAKQIWNGQVSDNNYKWTISFTCGSTGLMHQLNEQDSVDEEWLCSSVTIDGTGVTLVGHTQDNTRQVTIAVACQATGEANKVTWPYSDTTYVTVSGDVSDLQYTLNATSKCACTGGCSGTTMAFPVFGVLVLVGVPVGFLLYFAIGAIVMFKVKERRGMECIPNLEFWKEFPWLIVTAFQFIFCCKRSDFAGSKF